MIEDYFFTKNTRWVLWGAFAVVLALLIFHAGVVVGQHDPMRGNMMYVNGEPAMPDGGMLGGIMPARGFVESGHGAVGTVTTVTPPTFVLQTRDGLTQTVYAGSSTVVTGPATDSRQPAYPSSVELIKTGEFVIVIGDPNDTDDGFLDARIIHILR